MKIRRILLPAFAALMAFTISTSEIAAASRASRRPSISAPTCPM